MSGKHLLLPSAKSAVLVPTRRGRAHYARLGIIAIGIVSVLVGAADVTARLIKNLGPDAAFLAFAPAGALTNPSLFPAATTTVIVPARLRIPSLGVNARVETAGVKADGTMYTPQNFVNVSWYSQGAKPGALGSAVFAGHVNNAALKPGVFEHLSQIKKGDYITVEDASGKSIVYKVSSVDEYPANASTDAIFATTGPSQIALITCDGDWVPSARTFERRLVVIAKPAY